MEKTSSWKMCVLVLLMISGLGACSERLITDAATNKRINLLSTQNDHVIVLESPGPAGTASARQILLPEFGKFVHVAADSNHFRWIGASNRMFPWVGKENLVSIFEPKTPKPPRIPHPNHRALTMLFQLHNGEYLTLLPLAGEASVSWLEVTENGDLILDYGSLGTDPIPQNTQVPLLAWYSSRNVYESISKAWELALSHSQVKAAGSLRNKKTYPEPLQYLGWCTWEQYRKNIDEQTLVKAIDKIEHSEAPIRWVLIDDGHQDDKNKLLKSLVPNKKKFPNGWEPITSKKQEDAIRWMGIWHGFLAHWDGIHIDHKIKDLTPFLTQNPARKSGLLPKDDMASSLAFYSYLVETIKTQGFDFMKTDNVSRSTLEYTEFSNAAVAQRQNVLALEQACEEKAIGLMNCSAQNTIDLLNATNSATMRTSPDYQKHNLATSKSQILQSIFNVTWLGQTLWPDHDMFHSSDMEVAETMAITKAMSGGPIYLSDAPTEFEPSVINPLCYQDGRLIRPEAPGVPLPESIFNDALYEAETAYKTIAPLKNGACAIAAYNLSTTSRKPLSAKVTLEDYTQASAMIQPYPGLWELPPEGLVIYDWQEQTGRVLDEKGLPFQIDGFGHKLYLLCPIQRNWAVIGNPDKYLSPSTVDIIEIKEDRLTLNCSETTSLVFYANAERLSSPQMNITPLGGNFYLGLLKAGDGNTSPIVINNLDK